MNLDAGRFERPPVVRGVGRPATASNFTLDHPQGEPNRPSRLVLKKTHQVGWPKANFVQTGRRDLLPVAGFNIPSWRPAYSCDPQIISHEEHPPLPPRPQTPRSAVMQANAAYIREVEAQVQVDGVIGDVARVAAIKACFGVQESPRRPPTAPGQMLVGKPRQERPSTAGSVATTTAASASQQQIPTPRLHSARGVHSRHVAPASRALQRSQSHNFVKANQVKAGLTPRTHAAAASQQRMHEKAHPPKKWVMPKFQKVQGKMKPADMGLVEVQ